MIFSQNGYFCYSKLWGLLHTHIVLSYLCKILINVILYAVLNYYSSTITVNSSMYQEVYYGYPHRH